MLLGKGVTMGLRSGTDSDVKTACKTFLFSLLCPYCAVTQFGAADSSSMEWQEKSLFLLAGNQRRGVFLPPLLLGFPAMDEQDWQDPLAVTWLV